jgi:hypothetical protein
LIKWGGLLIIYVIYYDHFLPLFDIYILKDKLTNSPCQQNEHVTLTHLFLSIYIWKSVDRQSDLVCTEWKMKSFEKGDI